MGQRNKQDTYIILLDTEHSNSALLVWLEHTGHAEEHRP